MFLQMILFILEAHFDFLEEWQPWSKFSFEGHFQGNLGTSETTKNYIKWFRKAWRLRICKLFLGETKFFFVKKSKFF